MAQPHHPLARSARSDVLDWEGVEREGAPRPADLLGLRPEDRAALGMSAARPIDIAPTLSGDAHAALVEALTKGAAIRKGEPRPKRR